MAIFKDSLGNSYSALPTRKPNPSAKGTKTKESKRRRQTKAPKYARYRAEGRREKNKARRIARNQSRGRRISA